ncbi:MAG TPA: citramalate synthase [Verrucomicrobiae bacterium]|nr:citramalate synthase [Verrucomicrobiae bacterium]
MNAAIQLYDTTLRDGAQGQGVSLSVNDKLLIARRLDQLGVAMIEGGWPGSNPKDIEFFQAAARHPWQKARVAAFGSTRRVGVRAEGDEQVRLLIDAATPIVTIFGKTWTLHIEEVLRTTRAENLAMISDTVRHLVANGREVVYDAEHFFDGCKADSAYALDCVAAASEAGAATVVLCDTNGGTLPREIALMTAQVLSRVRCRVGIHTHDDSGLGVANALAAIESGATHVQGTMNGFGERTGNCNLTTLIPILQLKMGLPVVSDAELAHLREVSLFIDDVANQNSNPRAPFVGAYAFAHKGGMHVNAVNKVAASYEHIPPQLVGNSQHILVGELSGRTNVFMKARDLGISLDEKAPETRDILETIKGMEAAGYEFESADASFELLVRKALQHHRPFFETLEYRVSVRHSVERRYEVSEATVKLRVRDAESYTVADGDGPVNALDQALRKALRQFHPSLDEVRLTDYKVRIIDSTSGTEARTRVLISSTDGRSTWNTVGVSDNILDASWLALAESIEFFLLRREMGPKTA